MSLLRPFSTDKNLDTLFLGMNVQNRGVGLNGWGKRYIRIGLKSLMQEFQEIKVLKTDAELDFLLLNLSNIS